MYKSQDYYVEHTWQLADLEEEFAEFNMTCIGIEWLEKVPLFHKDRTIESVYSVGSERKAPVCCSTFGNRMALNEFMTERMLPIIP